MCSEDPNEEERNRWLGMIDEMENMEGAVPDPEVEQRQATFHGAMIMKEEMEKLLQNLAGINFHVTGCLMSS